MYSETTGEDMKKVSVGETITDIATTTILLSLDTTVNDDKAIDAVIDKVTVRDTTNEEMNDLRNDIAHNAFDAIKNTATNYLREHKEGVKKGLQFAVEGLKEATGNS